MTEPEMHQLLKRITDIAGEHCRTFVFIGQVDVGEGDTRVVSNWQGDFNCAIGITERMKERLRQTIISQDFPDDPPEDGEDWKAPA